jgi:hypothetical protein
MVGASTNVASAVIDDPFKLEVVAVLLGATM